MIWAMALSTKAATKEAAVAVAVGSAAAKAGTRVGVGISVAVDSAGRETAVSPSFPAQAISKIRRDSKAKGRRAEEQGSRGAEGRGRGESKR
jgi:hypothetical protein